MPILTSLLFYSSFSLSFFLLFIYYFYLINFLFLYYYPFYAFILLVFNLLFFILVLSLFWFFPWLLHFYSEQYFTLIGDIIKTTLLLIENWKKVPLCSLLYYLLYTTGYAISIVSIKWFIDVSLIIGNIIDIYLSGIMVVLINPLLYSGYFGTIVSSYPLYYYLTRMELFLILSWLLEPFSIISQSLTLSNRLSINISAGYLSISLLAVAVLVFSSYILITSIIIFLLLLIYSFEILNSFVQLFIFYLLTFEYLQYNCIYYLYSYYWINYHY